MVRMTVLPSKVSKVNLENLLSEAVQHNKRKPYKFKHFPTKVEQKPKPKISKYRFSYRSNGEIPKRPKEKPVWWPYKTNNK